MKGFDGGLKEVNMEKSIEAPFLACIKLKRSNIYLVFRMFSESTDEVVVNFTITQFNQSAPLF